MTNTETAAPATVYTSALRASDLSRRVTDTLRDHWTKGKLRILHAVLPAGTPLVMTLDRRTGFTAVGVTLDGVVESTTHTDGGPRVTSTYNQPTVYSWRNIGDTIVPLADFPYPSVKSEMVDLWSRIASAAVADAASRHGDVEGRSWGQWNANVDSVRPGVVAGTWRVHVTYTPSTGNSAFADRWGTRWSGEVDVAPRER